MGHAVGAAGGLMLKITKPDGTVREVLADGRIRVTSPDGTVRIEEPKR